MRAIWREPKPAYHGQFVSFANVQAHPQRNIRIVMGGRSPAAYRRAVEYAVGWYGFALNLEGTARALEGLHEAAERYPRPAELGRLEISITPRGPVNRETAEQFAALGVHRAGHWCALWPHPGDPDHLPTPCLPVWTLPHHVRSRPTRDCRRLGHHLV